MYSQTIVLNDANIAEIAKLAFFFVVDDLLETCHQFINSTVTLKNCIDLYARLNQVAEFKAGSIFLQTLDKSIDLLKVPLAVIQSRFHDVYIQSEALVNSRSEDIVHLLSKGVAKACTIDGMVRFVIRWLQKHPQDDGFEVASLLLDVALEKSRIPMPGTVSSWTNVTSLYDKIEAVLGGSSISQAYQTGLLTKMSAILEQLESQEYYVIKELETSASVNFEVKEEEKVEPVKEKEIQIVKDEQKQTESESKVSKKKHVCSDKDNCKKCKTGITKRYHLRKKLRKHDDGKRVKCKVCKLEFREKYQLERHTKRVHSKKGKVSLKISLSKSKITRTRKSTKPGKLKAVEHTDVKKEAKTEEDSVDKDTNTEKMPNKNESEKIDKRKSSDKRKSKRSSMEADYSDISEADDGDMNKIGKTVGDDYLHEIQKVDESLSNTDNDPDSDSTIENQPITVNDQINSFDGENNIIGSGVNQGDIDKVFGDFIQSQCFECKRIFKDNNSLKAHLRSHTNLRPYICKLCNTSFKRSSHLRRHERMHSQQKPFECILCQTKFEDNGGLKAHLKTHSEDRPFQCDICQRGYKDERDFIRHSMLHSQTEKLFKCGVCDKSFMRKYHLTRHTLIHQGKIARKHKCPHCVESFSRTKALQKHLPTHNGEPGILEDYIVPITSHTCEVCGYTFADVNNLIRHIRVHTGEKPFSCDICGKAFSQKGQLNIHKLTHGGTRQYQCEMCPKLFLTNSGLHKHRRQVHSNYRPYRCEYCGKQFLQKSDLRRHVPMHTGEKNYQCDMCAQLFARKDKLVSHFKQEHTQELQ